MAPVIHLPELFYSRDIFEQLRLVRAHHVSEPCSTYGSEGEFARATTHNINSIKITIAIQNAKVTHSAQNRLVEKA